MTVNPPTPHGRRAVRNDGAAHPSLATVFLFAALASMAAAFGSAYERPWLLTWVLGAAAVVFAALFVWALLPDGGPDDCGPDACAPWCTEYAEDDETDDLDEADWLAEADEDARWFGGLS